MSKLAIQGFFLLEFSFKIYGQSSNSGIQINGPGSSRSHAHSLTLSRAYRRRRTQMPIQETILIGLIALIIISFDYYTLRVYQHGFLSQMKYLSALLIQIFTTVYIYQYKIRCSVKENISKSSELLKVKWLSHLYLCFVTPTLTFVFNQTPNYVILRFQKNPLIILLVALAVSINLAVHVVFYPSQTDFNSKPLKKKWPIVAVICVSIISYTLLKTQDSWIVNHF